VTGPRHEFTVQASKDIYVGKVMALRADDVVMPGGGVAVREIVEHPGAVAIAALDADDRLMMIHQYRHAVGRRLWELPAGLLDVRGEDPLITAQRELTEETGLTASDWSTLIDLLPSPGFTEESVRVYLARGLTDVGRPAVEGDEEADLTTRWVSLPVAVRMVLSGTIVNATTVSGVLRTRHGRTAPRASPTGWPDRAADQGRRGRPSGSVGSPASMMIPSMNDQITPIPTKNSSSWAIATPVCPV
jgi:8-oxo-dGDP phosphatase